MADTLTTNYNFTKPEIGGATDTWGAKLSANWDSVDSILAGMSAAVQADITANIDTILASAVPATARANFSVYSIAEADSAISAGIAALVASSPATLDTLNELAAALGDDPNFATTMTTALAGKLAVSAKASTAEGEAGTDNSKYMTALAVAAAIAAQVDTAPPTDYGAVGTYVLAWSYAAVFDENDTVAGSTLYPASMYNSSASYAADTPGAISTMVHGDIALSGTWRAMSGARAGGSANRFALYVRIS